MKLVFLCDAWSPLIGGGQKLFSKLVTGLVKDHDCEITVITRALCYEGKIYDNQETYFNQRLKVIRLKPALPFFNLFGRIWFIVQSAIYALKFKPNIYLASTWLPALSLKLISLFSKTPQALIVIGFGSQKFSWLETLISQKLKFSLIISDDYQFCQTRKNIKFIPNGVDLLHSSREALAKWGQFTFLTIARNEPRKGIPILRKAFALVKQQFPQVKLRLFGPGFKTLSQQDLDTELFKAHCLVLPSLAEGHPLILFEAWAHHLPVIATDVGSVSQFVNQANGYLIPTNDVSALVKAMKLAIHNPKLATLGTNGYKLVSQHYSWSKTIAQYYQALKTLQ